MKKILAIIIIFVVFFAACKKTRVIDLAEEDLGTPTLTPTLTNTPTITPTFDYTPNEADDPNIIYIGRWNRADLKNPATGWGAAGFKTKFQGTSITVKMNDTANRFSYRIDGGSWRTLTCTAATNYTLQTGLANTDHTFEMYRRNEGGSGNTIFQGVTLDAGKVLVSPGARPSRRMLFIGDSITAGYGCECMYQGGCSSGNSFENINGNQSWAPRLARLFNADYQVIAQSGAGLYMNAAGSLTDIMPTYYQQTYRSSATPAWNDAYWENPSVPGASADVIIIMLGTNDFTQYAKTIYPNETEWKTAMNNFLDILRADHPNAHIFMTSTFYTTSPFNNAVTWNNQIMTARGNPSWLHTVNPMTAPAWIDMNPANGDVMSDWTHPLCHDDIHGNYKIAQRYYTVVQPILGW